MQTNEQREAIAQAVDRAGRDAAYRALLLSDPTLALKAFGISVPDTAAFKVVENTAETIHLPLPPPPRPGEDRAAALERMAAESPFDDTVQYILSMTILHLTRFANAWSDPAFRKRLETDPNSALASLDAAVPQSVRLEIVETAADARHIVLPPLSPA